MGAKADRRPRRVAFTTLGCKLNLYETDALATRFTEGGYEIVDFADPADVYVINSCTVTNKADRKSRNLLYRALRATGTGPAAPAGQQPETDVTGRAARAEPLFAENGTGPLVVLTGCFVESHRDELEGDGRTIVVPNEQKHAIYDLVQARRRGEVITAAGSVFDFPVPDRTFHTRTMLKIQDGCDNFCTFCIIPLVRGRATSRPAAEVVSAAKSAVSGGARELVLTGVNMSRYRDGTDRFSDLLARILEVAGEFRVRISSLEPDQLDERFISLFAHPKMCPHLHLCVQSGSERVLLAMRRQYTYAQFRDIAERLRAIHPDFNLTTDIIAGFPGETDEDFEKSLDAIDQIGFGHVHTFPYSERSGTRAQRMPGRVPERIRTQRAALIRERAAAEKRRYRECLVGTVQRLLVERVHRDGRDLVLSGFGQHYVPVSVTLRGSLKTAWQNQFVDVRILDTDGSDEPVLTGVPANTVHLV